ncbi:MAG: PAS domain S-box protein [Rhodomicrobium sp.]
MESKSQTPPPSIEPKQAAAVLDVPELDRISDAFFALDLDGRFTYLNPAMERTMGRQRAGALGQKVESCWPEADGTPLQEALNTASRSWPSRFIAYFPPRSTFYEVLTYPSATGLSVLLREAGQRAGHVEAGPGGQIEAIHDPAVEQTGTWRLDVQGKQLLWSDENYRIFDIPKGAPLSYEAFLATIQSNSQEVIDRSWQSAPRGTAFDTEREVVVGGKKKWVRERAKLEFDEQGQLTGGFGTTLDITAHKQTEHDLAQSHARFESVVESAMDAIIAVDANQRILLFNSAAEAMFHCTSTMVLGQPVDRLIPERFRSAHAGHIATFGGSGITRRAMGQLGILWGMRADGTEFPIEAAISQSETGRSKIFTVILRDVTERLKAEERQRLLTAELDHRVKNMLASVSAVINMSARGARTVAEFSDTVAARLHAMTSAHNLLQRTRWGGADLALLCELVLGPYRSQTGNIRLEGVPLTLTPKAAQSIALAFNELVTNALKYGALSVPDGRVSVSWWRTTVTAEPDRVRVVWRESGGPPVAVPARKGFGLSVLQNMIAYDLNAAVNCEFHPQGLMWVIDGPLAQQREQAEDASRVTWLPRTGEQPLAQAKRILILEDEGAVALQLKALIEGRGHTVAGPAARIKDAEQLIEKGEFDAALLDIRLADGNVMPIALRLIERKVPIAFLTGSADPALPEALKSVPMLVKPFTDAEVLAVVARLCG